VSAIESSNTQNTTPGTEHILASPTTLHTRILSVDVSALSGAETVALRIKGPVLVGGTQQVILGPISFAAGTLAPFVQLPAIMQTQGGDITLQQTGGSSRAFPWVIATID
jgi:hypothetical protein